MVLRGYNRLLGRVELPMQASAQPPYHWEQQELATERRGQLARHGYGESQPLNHAGHPDFSLRPAEALGQSLRPIASQGYLELGRRQRPPGIQDIQSLEIETSPTSTWTTMMCKI